MTGDLVDVVRHVADLLTVFGERLRAGELIITGSIVPPVWLAGKEEIRYRLDPVDTISIKLEA
jgi:2-keto-4-pentenoate hydratase